MEPPGRRRPPLAAVVTATITAERLRALHRPGAPLMLPNVWDAASARAVRAAGFPAVATSSAALAEALGYADGEAAPVAEVLDAVARIAAAVPVPVTADLERGYGMAPAELVERLAATGAVGCNLEDSRPGTGALVEVGEQVDFIAGVREAARTAGVDLVINARIDTYLRGDSPPAGGAPAGGDRLAETVARAEAYLGAGADCVYPILLTDPDAIRALVARGPVNVYYRLGAAGTPGPAELAR